MKKLIAVMSLAFVSCSTSGESARDITAPYYSSCKTEIIEKLISQVSSEISYEIEEFNMVSDVHSDIYGVINIKFPQTVSEEYQDLFLNGFKRKCLPSLFLEVDATQGGLGVIKDKTKMKEDAGKSVFIELKNNKVEAYSFPE